MKKKKDLSTYAVPPECCTSCPFGGKKPINLNLDYLAHLYKQLLKGDSQHICHSRQKAICRGGRTIQLRWFHSIGLLSEPTDEAFNQAIADAKK
jgi:hypothetical protein